MPKLARITQTIQDYSLDPGKAWLFPAVYLVQGVGKFCIYFKSLPLSVASVFKTIIPL